MIVTRPGKDRGSGGEGLDGVGDGHGVTLAVGIGPCKLHIEERRAGKSCRCCDGQRAHLTRLHGPGPIGETGSGIEIPAVWQVLYNHRYHRTVARWVGEAKVDMLPSNARRLQARYRPKGHAKIASAVLECS